MKKLLIAAFIAAATLSYAEEGATVKLPSFIANTKIKGDFRFRYESKEKENDDHSRERARVRLRLGFESQINELWTVAYGFSTGADDPRSANHTLGATDGSGNVMATPDLRTDYAFAKLNLDSYQVYLGKIKNPMFQAEDMLWSGDLRPDGAMATSSFAMGENTNLFVNLGYFIQEEVKAGADPAVIPFQIGARSKLGAGKLEGSLDYYRFANDANFTDDAGDYVDGAYALNAVYSQKLEGALKSASGALQYVGSGADEDNTGYAATVELKAPKWSFSTGYRHLESYAWTPMLGDDTVLPNHEGFKVKFSYSIAKNTSLGVNYYNTDKIDGDSNAENKYQAELKYKF